MIYNLTLQIFWTDGTEAAPSQHTTVHIGKGRELQYYCPDVSFTEVNSAGGNPIIYCALGASCYVYLTVQSFSCGPIELSYYRLNYAYIHFPGNYFYYGCGGCSNYFEVYSTNGTGTFQVQLDICDSGYSWCFTQYAYVQIGDSCNDAYFQGITNAGPNPIISCPLGQTCFVYLYAYSSCSDSYNLHLCNAYPTSTFPGYSSYAGSYYADNYLDVHHTNGTGNFQFAFVICNLQNQVVNTQYANVQIYDCLDAYFQEIMNAGPNPIMSCPLGQTCTVYLNVYSASCSDSYNLHLCNAYPTSTFPGSNSYYGYNYFDNNFRVGSTYDTGTFQFAFVICNLQGQVVNTQYANVQIGGDPCNVAGIVTPNIPPIYLDFSVFLPVNFPTFYDTYSNVDCGVCGCWSYQLNYNGQTIFSPNPGIDVYGCGSTCFEFYWNDQYSVLKGHTGTIYIDGYLNGTYRGQTPINFYLNSAGVAISSINGMNQTYQYTIGDPTLTIYLSDFKDALDSLPVSHDTGWFYYNTIEGVFPPQCIPGDYWLNIYTTDPLLVGQTDYFEMNQSFYSGQYLFQTWVQILFVQSCVVTNISVQTAMITTGSLTLGGSSLTILFPTFIQTPACNEVITYAFLIDGVSTAPVWLSTDLNNLWFLIQSSDISLAGDHTIQITSSYNSLLNNVQTVTVTFVIPCNLTTWNTATINSITTSIDATPAFTQLITAFSTVATGCGTIDYVLSPSTNAFISFDPISMMMTVATSLVADIGSYSINLVGSLPAYPMITPISVPFTVTINSCAVTSIVGSTSMITATTFTLGTPLTILFPTFTQTPACNDIISYTFLIDGVATIPVWITTDVTNQQFLLSSSDITLVGVHTIQITSTHTSLLNNVQSISVTIALPCDLTTWNSATINSITTSIDATPAFTQLITAFSTIATGCGTIDYVLSPSTYAFISFDPITMMMTVATSLVADIGSYSINLVGSLPAYPMITPISVPFTVTINSCAVTSIVGSTSMITATTFTLGTPLTILFPTFTQTPACNDIISYTFLIDGVATIPVWITTDVTNQQFLLSSSDITLVGVHTIQITSTHTSLLNNVQSISVTIALPCDLTTWNSATINSITTSIDATPAFTQLITAFSTVATGCGTIDYVLSPSTNAFISFDPISMMMTVATSLVADIGSYSINLVGSLPAYPMITPISVPFTVTISSCAVTSIVGSTSMITATTFTLGTPLTILFPTFTQTPACNDIISYTFLIDSVATIPVWLTTDLTNQMFLLSSSDVSLVGLHTIQITSYYFALLSDVQNVSVTFIIPCDLTTWNTAAISSITTSVSAIPAFTQLITAFSTVATGCGTIDYVLSPSTYAFISFDPITMMMTVATSLSTDIGTYSSLNLIGSLTSYPLVTPLTVPFSVVIGQCTVTSTSCTNCANNAISTPVTIFAPAVLISLAQYVQTPLCNSPVIDTLDADQIPTNGGYILQPFWAYQSGSTTVGSVYSNDYTLNGIQFSFRQITIIDTFTLTVTKTYTFTDPCPTTSFVAQTLIDIDSFVYGLPQQITFPSLSDTISNLYGAGVCYTQVITQISSGGLPVAYATLSGFIWTIQTNDPTLAGNYIIDVSYQLTRYPAVTTLLSFNLRMFILNIPQTIPNQTYQATSPQLMFNSNLYSYTPLAIDKILTHSVTKTDGTALPSFIQFVLTQSTIDFTILTQLNSDVGIYEILINATLSPISGVGTSITASSIFIITITAAPVVTFANFPPSFITLPSISFDVNIGDPWSYTLPDTQDPEGLIVTISAELGSASLFMTFSNSVLNIAAGASLQSIVQSYTLIINLKDPVGAQTNYTITLNLKELGTIVQSSNSTTSNLTLSQNNTVSGNGTEVSTAVAQQMLTESLGNLSTTIGKESIQAFAKLAGLKPNAEFNWADAFASALKKNNKINTKAAPNPIARIVSISRTGDVLISFDQTMVVSPINVIKSETVIVDNQKVPALQLKIKPGYYSNIDNLTFSYNFTEFTSRTIRMSLEFNNPDIVSTFDDPDKLEIIFNGYYFFFSQYGKTIDPKAKLETSLPRQLVKGGFASALAGVTGSISTTTNAVMAGNLALNIVLSASLQQLWSMINTQQIIVLMPLFNVNLPPNAAVFFGFIMQIASFDILPTDLFYNDYFNMDVTGSLNDNFNSVGLNSHFLLYNLGSMIVGILTMPLIILVILLLKICRANNDRIHRWHNQLSRYMFWSHPITVFLESYTMLAVCSLINVSHVSFSFVIVLQPSYQTWGDTVSTSLSIFCLLICILVPIILATVMYRKFTYLLRPLVNQRWGIIYSGLKLKQGRTVIFQPMNYFFRRFMLAVVIVCQDKLIVQILMIHFSYVMQLIILGFVEPFKDPHTQKMDYINEVVILGTLYCMMCFSDLVPDQKIQFYIGWICCLIISSHLFINLFFMLLASGKQLVLIIKRCKKRIVHNKRKRQAILDKEENMITKQEIQQARQERKKLAESIRKPLDKIVEENEDNESQPAKKEIQNEQSNNQITAQNIANQSSNQLISNQPAALTNEVKIDNFVPQRLYRRNIDQAQDIMVQTQLTHAVNLERELIIKDRNLNNLLEDTPETTDQFINRIRKKHNIDMNKPLSDPYQNEIYQRARKDLERLKQAQRLQ